MQNDVFDKVKEAYTRINDQVICTDLIFNEGLSKATGVRIFLKLENTQHTNSFKYRGACNKITLLKEEHPDIKEVVAASTGNHAAAVLEVSTSFGIRPIIYVPHTIADSKLKKLQAGNAEVRVEGEQSGDSELLATEFSKKTGIQLVHPYNDIEVVAGQGTIGIEILDQLPSVKVVIVPVGGGGLISGIAGYLKGADENIHVIGVQPFNAPDMVESIRQNKILPAFTTPTISDGTAGGLEPGSITYELCKAYVDEWDTVTEEEIAQALYLIYKYSGKMVEPAAALTLASAIKNKEELKDKNVVLIVCGGNIDEKRFFNIIKPYHDGDH